MEQSGVIERPADLISNLLICRPAALVGGFNWAVVETLNTKGAGVTINVSCNRGSDLGGSSEALKIGVAVTAGSSRGSLLGRLSLLRSIF